MKEQIGPSNGITLGVRFRIVNAFELDSTVGKTYAQSIVKTQLGVPCGVGGSIGLVIQGSGVRSPGLTT